MSITRGRRRPVALAATVVALLVLGALVASQVGAALGLASAPARVAVERPATGSAAPAVTAPRLDAVVLPEGTGSGVGKRRLALAARSVATALADRGAPRPRVTEASPGGTVLRVAYVSELPGGKGPEAFRLRSDGEGLRLDAATVAGAANGLHAVADRVRSGAEVLPAGDDGRTVAPALPLRLTDHGAVGLSDDPADFDSATDYSLNSDIVGPALLPRAPWVDDEAVEETSRQFRRFVDHALTRGYNGVLVPGFLEYVTFSGVGDGHAVYPRGDPHPERAKALRAAFGPLWKYAHDMGMKVYFQTDMLSLSPPLKDYLGDKDTADPRLWSVYQAGLHELYTTMPYVDGLVVRIGEGGGAYKLDGWDYYSAIEVTTPAQVRAMLTALLEQSARDDRDLVFRTWTVGVGEVGDLHTNAATYEEVLGGIDDEHLIVSTKYTLGDFYSHLPLNETLRGGDHRRIVEFQSRREFEGLGALPNDLGPLHQEALRSFLADNPRIVGIWNWTQDGGPVYAGPRALYLRAGLWQLWDLNVYVTGRLAWDPDLDVGAATDDWIRQTFSADPDTVSAIARMLRLSRTAITDGLYVGPYAAKSVKALGLEPPPMMWIFEWDVVTDDSASLDSVYHFSRDRVDEAVAEGHGAVETAAAMRRAIAGTPESGWHDPAHRRQLLSALEYQENLLATLAAYRATVLRHVQWLDTGSPEARAAWKDAEKRFRAAAAAHERRYGEDTALPAYEFTPALIGLDRADRDEAMAWTARALLVLLAAVFVLGSAPGQRLLRGRPGAAALRGLWLGATRPWRAAEAAAGAGGADRWLVWLVPAAALVLSRSALTWFLAPTHLVATLGAWLLFALVLRVLARGRDPFPLAAALGGVVLVRTVILLTALANRGPGRYWFDFWTQPHLRFVYVTLAFAAFCWVFVVAGVVLREAYGMRPRRAAGGVLAAAGLPLLVLGGVVGLLGLERALAVWNDQMALLPWALSRILGITVHLGIPVALPHAVAVVGAALLVTGVVLLTRRGARAPGPRPPAPAARADVPGRTPETSAEAGP